MRPLTIGPFTVAALSTTGFASNVTGATWTLTANDSGDSLAHQVTIRNDTATDHSAKTAVLTGTDENGVAQTETMALPGAGAGTTTTSTKYFKTLTSIVPSATIGADTMDIGWNANTSGQHIPLNFYDDVPPSIGVDVTLTGGGAITFTVQETHKNILGGATPVWSNITALAGKSADTTAPCTPRAAAVRVITTVITATAAYQVDIISGRGRC